ncbi:MAG: tripartite tricarboxylate transporter TctB family protein [Alphaproteobacteria bacterium]|nr:tripartite tricarboxylate transporter TctB family protein [Alphaproteobacteria bacterium]
MLRSLLRDGEAVAGILLAGLGVHIFATALSWDLMGPEGPGPGFFPLAYGGLMILLSLGLVTSRLRRLRQARNAAIDWAGHWRPLGTWAAFALAALAMPVLGFLVAFGALTVFVTMFVFGRPLATAAAVGASCALGFWIVFPVLLDVRLPVGQLGF